MAWTELVYYWPVPADDCDSSTATRCTGPDESVGRTGRFCHEDTGGRNCHARCGAARAGRTEAGRDERMVWPCGARASTGRYGARPGRADKDPVLLREYQGR